MRSQGKDKVELSELLISEHCNVVLDGDAASHGQPENMIEKKEEEEAAAWKDPGRQQRLEILTEVSSLLNDDSDNSSAATLPFSPRPEDKL